MAPVAMVRLEGVAHAVDQKCAVREVVQLVMEPLMAQFGLPICQREVEQPVVAHCDELAQQHEQERAASIKTVVAPRGM